MVPVPMGALPFFRQMMAAGVELEGAPPPLIAVAPLAEPISKTSPPGACACAAVRPSARIRPAAPGNTDLAIRI